MQPDDKSDSHTKTRTCSASLQLWPSPCTQLERVGDIHCHLVTWSVVVRYPNAPLTARLSPLASLACAVLELSAGQAPKVTLPVSLPGRLRFRCSMKHCRAIVAPIQRVQAGTHLFHIQMPSKNANAANAPSVYFRCARLLETSHDATSTARNGGYLAPRSVIVVHAALFRVVDLIFQESNEEEAAPVHHSILELNELWWARIACSNGCVFLWVTLGPPSSTAPNALEARPHCRLDLPLASQVNLWSPRCRQSNEG